MSVKHLEYLKISNSKVLVVEVRPVKCLLDTSLGLTHSDKWMEYSHWKELHHLMTDIVEEYEEERATQGIKYNQPKCKAGTTIQIGYMFRGLPSCWCSLYFLTPRNSLSWTKNNDGELQDKGGSFEDFTLCGEMLVISVILRDSSPSCTTDTVPTPSCSGSLQQNRLNHKLIKALDSRATIVNSISGYFKASATSADDSSAKCVPSSSRGRQKSPSMRVKASTKRNAEHESRGDECSESMNVMDSSDYDSSFNSSTSISLKDANSEEREMDLLCGYNSQHDIFRETKSFYDSVDYTKNIFRVINYENKNIENTETPMKSEYQCSDNNLDEMLKKFNSFGNESEEMLSDVDSPKNQHHAILDTNVSCSMSANPGNHLKDSSQLENVIQEPQTDCYIALDTNHETDENTNSDSDVIDSSLFCVVKEENFEKSDGYYISHEMDPWNLWNNPLSNCDENEQKVRSREDDRANASNLDLNELEIKLDGQENTLPHKIHNDYIPETNTLKRKIQSNSLRPEEKCTSSEEEDLVDRKNLINCAQVSEDLSLSVKSKDYVPERKHEVLAAEASVALTTPIMTFQAGKVQEENLHCHSDSTKKHGEKISNTRNAAQECLSPRMLLIPSPDSVLSVDASRESSSTDEFPLSTQMCESFNFVGRDMKSLQQTPNHRFQEATQLCSRTIVKEEQSRETVKSVVSMKASTKQRTSDEEQHENFSALETNCKGKMKNVRKKRRVHRRLIETSKVLDSEDEGKCMRMSFSSIFAVGDENGTREGFPPRKEDEHSNSENHQFKSNLLFDSSPPTSSCQNPFGATADSVSEEGKQNSAKNDLENRSIGCSNNEETVERFGYIYKPEIKLNSPGDTPHRADEYFPPKIACKWKKKKSERNMPNLELERKLSATNYRSSTPGDSVVQEGDLGYDIGASKAGPVGYSDKPEIELEFQNNAPCSVDKENVPVPEKMACNWKIEESKNVPDVELDFVPTNVKYSSTTNLGSYSDEDSVKKEDDFPHVSESLPLCAEERDYVPKRKRQHIQAIETCVSVFLCEEKSDSGNAFKENLNLLTDKNETQEIPDPVETQEECAPPQRLVSYGNGESDHRIDCQQSFQSSVQSTEAKKSLQRSAVYDHQEAAHKRLERKKITRCLRAFRITERGCCQYEGETYMKHKDIRSKKVCSKGAIMEEKTYGDQKETLKKEKIAGHAETTMNSDLWFNENITEESALGDNSFDTISSQNACVLSNSGAKEVDALISNMQPKNLRHELGSNSFQSSTFAVLKQDKAAENILYHDTQFTKEKRHNLVGREDERESNNLPTSSCKCGKQKTTWRDNSKAQLSIGINNPKGQVTEDNATEQVCVSKGAMLPKGKISTSKNKKLITKRKKSAEKCVTQAEGSDKSGHDTVMEQYFGESSRNCSSLERHKNNKDIRLSKENAPEQQSEEKYETELCPRRSDRLREKFLHAAWQYEINCEDSSEVDFEEKSDIAAETEKSIQFFEKYVKERNANSSFLQQQKIFSYMKPFNTLKQKNYFEEWSFKRTDNKRSPGNTKRKVSKSGSTNSITNKAAKELYGKDDTLPDLIKPTTSKCDTKEGPQVNVKRSPLKCHKEICDNTFQQRKESNKSNKTFITKQGKKSVLQEGKKVSSSEKPRKRVKKKTLTSGTSTVHDSKRNLENCTSASEKDALHWIMMAEMEEHEPVESDFDIGPDSSKTSQSSPRSEEESQLSERDEVDVVYSHNLASLKASYKRLQCMTESDLERRMDENISFLEHVVLGHVPNARHEMFISSLQELKQQQDYLISGPFTADQTEHVLELLKKKLSHLDSLFGSVYDVLTYRCRVLMPTFLTKIVMDNENINLKKAEELLIKFSLDQNITGTTNTRDWRKF